MVRSLTESSPDGDIWGTPARELLDRFDQAWRCGTPLSLQSLLPSIPDITDRERARLLQELIGVDLDYRWRPSSSCARLRLEDYVC